MKDKTFSGSDARFQKLNSYRRNVLAHGRYSRKEYGKLSEEEIQTICKYLENPTKVGIWTLKTKWRTNEGISKFISNKLKEKFEEEEIKIQDGKRVLKLKEEEKDELIRKSENLNFIIRLFSYMVYFEEEGTSISAYFENEDSTIRLIFDILDLKEIKDEYSEAFEFFKANIYYEGFNANFLYDRIERIKDGILVFVQSLNPEKNRKYIISLSPTPLEQMKILFEKIDMTSDLHIMPTYSPEEEVFAPYFVFLEKSYSHLIDINHIMKLFQNSISEYNDEDYSHCISTIGLIIEDYLIQVYETLLKDVCPKSLTMGELFNLIQGTISNKFKKPISNPPEIKPLYDSINELIKTPTDTSFNKKISTLVRDILTYIKKDKGHVCNMIDSTKTKDSEISVFPKNLINNIKEAIKNRNAISHKSTVPIGGNEALRTVYCCITFIIWWNNEKIIIDWKQNPEDILKKSIERNSNMTLN